MKREYTTKLAISAVFVAILILQSFVPNIGYIRILPALPAITTIPLTVAIYGSLLG
ncbi:ECF transporter S component, partial [Lactobacillus sp. XV13L]|nr:ECF transporter S component [Lactobacillus sp. XV13L]